MIEVLKTSIIIMRINLKYTRKLGCFFPGNIIVSVFSDYQRKSFLRKSAKVNIPIESYLKNVDIPAIAGPSILIFELD